MNVKSFFLKIIASILGIFVLGLIVKVIGIVLLILYFLVLKPESISDIQSILLVLIIIVGYIFGIYLGLKAYHTKNEWYNIFKPTWNKVIISGMFSLSLVILAFILGWSFVQSYTLKPVSMIIGMPLTFIRCTILFYPFSSLCNHVYQSKKNNSFKNSKRIILLLLIILNPIFIIFSEPIGAVFRDAIINEPCGMRINAFDELSPVKDAGMQVGEIIIKLNDVKINSLKDLKKYMNSYDPSINLTVYTYTNSYFIKPVFVDERYLLGVNNLTQEMCKRSFI